MAETKFTPGPWRVERMYDGGSTVAIMRDWSRERTALAVHAAPAWIHQPGVGPHTIEANAHLIAQSPALYALIDQHANLFAELALAAECTGNEDGAREWSNRAAQARALLKTARGEA